MDDSCIICLDKIKKKYIQLECSHKFHKLCILSWFKQSYLCPLCRNLNDFNYLNIKGIDYYNLYIIIKCHPILLFTNPLSSYLNSHKKELIYILKYSNILELIKLQYDHTLLFLTIINNSDYLIFKHIIKIENINYLDLANNSYLMYAIKYNNNNNKIRFFLHLWRFKMSDKFIDNF